jgi:uncharacterized protein YneR
MKFQVTSEAADWYKTEMVLNNGDKIRFFVRYGGFSTVQRGFSLGIELTDPVDVGVLTSVNGITFFIEEKDLWYFSGHDLLVSFNEKINEPVFEYSKV